MEEFISSDLDAILDQQGPATFQGGHINKIESISEKMLHPSSRPTWMNLRICFREGSRHVDNQFPYCKQGEAQKMFQMDAGEATGRIPLSRGELLEATMRQGANDRLRQLERQAASAAAPRLTRPGPQNVMQTQQDVDRFRRAVLFQQALDNFRVGTIPGLLGPTSESVRNFGESMIR